MTRWAIRAVAQTCPHPPHFRILMS